MNFKEAIDALKKLDNGTELASVFEAEVDRLNAKSYELVGEKRTETQKKQAYESALMAIAKAAGVEGDIEAVLTNAESKVRAIVSEAAQLKTDKTTLETRATEAEGKVQGWERKAKLSEIATAAGANAAVLERLLGDKFDQLKIEGEGDARVVKLGDKPLKEAIASDEGLKLFEAALFPQVQQQKSPAPKLPSGSPKTETSEKVDPVSSYMKRTYAVPTAEAK